MGWLAVLHGVIWDFDGTILDTETPQFEAWLSLYSDYGVIFTLDDWSGMVGTISDADPVDLLERQVGPLNRESLYQQYEERYQERMRETGLLPGVQPLLEELTHRGISCAIASSSSRGWIHHYLIEYGISRYFSAVASAQDVGVPKPDPGVYRLALSLLRLMPNEVLAIEDSPHGAKAAQAAGVACLVVPNASTRGLEFPSGLLATLTSLEGMTAARFREMLE